MSVLIVRFFFLALAAVFAFTVGAVFVSFSEHREYSSGGLLDYLLTPIELSVLSGRCKDKPVFIYSSADGPKPTTVTMSCTIAKQDFDRPMNSVGFHNIGGGLYRGKGATIQVIVIPDKVGAISMVFIESSL